MNQTGNVKNFDYDRYNLRTNIEAKIAKSLTFTFGVAGQIGDRKEPGFPAGGTSGTSVSTAPWLSIAEQAAYAHPYLPKTYDGLPTASQNNLREYDQSDCRYRTVGLFESQTVAVQTNAALQWDLPWVRVSA